MGLSTTEQKPKGRQRKVIRLLRKRAKEMTVNTIPACDILLLLLLMFLSFKIGITDSWGRGIARVYTCMLLFADIYTYIYGGAPFVSSGEGGGLWV